MEGLEAGEATPADLEGTGEKVRAALRAAGIVFLDGDEPGLKLRRTGPPNEGTRVQDLTSDNDD